jgi:GT2 family glycosyltransferase
VSPELSAIIVNYRQAALARRCAATLREAFSSEGIEGEIVLVDCASGEAESAALEAVPADVCLRLPDNRGYAGGINAGLSRASGRRILLSNADVEYRPGALTALLASLEDPRVGAAAPVCAWDAAGRVLLPPGFSPGFLEELALLSPPRAGRGDLRRFAAFAREAIALWTRGGSARHLSGAVLAARRDAFDRAGRFDERFSFEYEETEWEGRVRALRMQLRVVAEARVRHLWGASASGDPETVRRRVESRRLFRQRRYGRFGRVLLERAERRGGAPRPAGLGRHGRKPASARRGWEEEIPARSGAWIGLSPNASGIPFAGADLSRPFRLPEELEATLPAGDWLCTVFSAHDGRPIESFLAGRR